MSDDKLTLVEASALLILMVEARELASSYLTKEVRVDLREPSRTRLSNLGLIEVRKEGRRLFLNLTDRGWREALTMIGDEPPRGAGSAGAALYRLVSTTRKYLNRADVPAADFFAGEPSEAAPSGSPAGDDVVDLIRKAYDGLATEPGSPVRLARIRASLGGLSRAQVDETLIEMSRLSDIRIFAESNQKTLTDDDRAASISIGNRDKHFIAIGS